METHIRITAWLWILNGFLSICMAIGGLTVIGLNVVDTGDATLAGAGVGCFFLPGVIAYLLTGYGLLNYKFWARILAMVLAIPNLLLFPIGTILGIYTLWVMLQQETLMVFEVKNN